MQIHRICRYSIVAVLVAMTAIGNALSAELQILPDLVYGHKDGMALTLDVIKPPNANGVGIIYMVSGGWISTYRPPREAATSNALYARLLEKGFTVIPVRHGSSPKYVIPEIVSDVRRAIRFIRFNARQWGLDPERLGVTGASAGGHLSLVIAAASDIGDPNAAEAFLKESNRVAAVVAFYPPVDLRQWARGALTGPPPAGQRFPALNFNREEASAYSPIVHVSRDDPPTLLIHGDKDELVPISHSESMYQALQEAGVKSQFVTMPGAEHGFRGADQEKAHLLTISWFEQTLLRR